MAARVAAAYKKKNQQTSQRKIQDLTHKNNPIYLKEKNGYICIHHKEYINALLLSIFIMTVHCVAVHN